MPAGPCPNTRSAKVLHVALAFFAGSVFYALVQNVNAYFLALDIEAGNPVHVNDLYRYFEGSDLVGLGLRISSWLVSFIAFMYFFSRTVKAAQGAGAEGMMSKPSTAIWGSFLPFVNLYIPYRVMQESWKATDYESDANSWVSAKGSTTIALWWAFWVGSRLYSYFSGKSTESLTHQEAAFGNLIQNALDLGLALSALFMVQAVAGRCQAKWEKAHGPQSIPQAKVKTR
jgi:hypothetical protein